VAVGDLAGARGRHGVGSRATIAGHAGVESLYYRPGEHIVRKLPKNKHVFEFKTMRPPYFLEVFNSIKKI
jgi:hypothetical protein